MRKWWVWVLVLVAAGGLAAAYAPELIAPRTAARPRPVRHGDREVAWLHNPTAFDAWENFVWGVKRAEMAGDGGPDGLEVDDSHAFPDKTTAVPEVVLRRKGFAGSVRFRWYKLTNTSTQADWVNALATVDPPPLAVLGGWSSDRARELADAMRDAKWRGARPLLFLTVATADRVDPEDDSADGPGPSLVSIYDRTFRFCFTNRQMATSVTDFVLSDPTLRPGPIALPGMRALGAATDLIWPTLPALAFDTTPPADPLPAHAIEWRDDPYSTDLCFKFREALQQCSTGDCDLPRIAVTTHSVPFSTGRLNRPNPAEAQVAEHILANLPPPGFRSVLVIPTVSAPARRTLRALVQGNANVGRQLVAVTGDGMGVNVFFRDREFAWPTRSISIPLVLFTHADPFGWDAPGAAARPPAGYEMTAPRPGAVRSSTEDIRLYTRLTRVVAAGAFPEGETELVQSPDRLAEQLQGLRPAFFDRSGDRLGGTGEHVVVLRPTFAAETTRPRQPDGVLEVYSRQPGRTEWVRVHTRPLSRVEGGPQE